MTVVMRAPSPALVPFVAALGYYGTALVDARDLLLPTGSMHLAVNLTEDQTRWYDGDGLPPSTAGVARCCGAPRLARSASTLPANAPWCPVPARTDTNVILLPDSVDRAGELGDGPKSRT
jgi:hypothetical protein